MKRIFFVLLFSLFNLIWSCVGDDCSGGFTTTTEYISIESVHIGIHNKEELLIEIKPDSLSRTFAKQYNESEAYYLFACSPPPFRRVNQNEVDSINVFTHSHFNDKFPANSNINAILELVDTRSGTYNPSISEISIVHGEFFRFKEQPTTDTLQFLITGRITNKGSFSLTSEKIVL